MSGVERVHAAEAFRDTEITAIMGGVQLDLRRAQLPAGAEAVIDLLAVMGGVELLLPPDWHVSAPFTAILGGIEDKRLVEPASVIEAAGVQPGRPRLVIRGFVLMGGVNIR